MGTKKFFAALPRNVPTKLKVRNAPEHVRSVFLLEGVEDLPVSLSSELVTCIPVEDMEVVESDDSISQPQEADTPDHDEGTCTYLNVILYSECRIFSNFHTHLKHAKILWIDRHLFMMCE